MYFRYSILFAVLLCLLASCAAGPVAPAKPKESSSSRPSSSPPSSAAPNAPLPPEKLNAVLSEVGENWIYGPGMGETAMNVAGAIIFPPYALFLLGNAALQFSGEKPVEISDVLPDDEKRQWQSVYSSVTSGPGQFSAALAGEEFRTREVAKERFENVLGKEMK